MIEHGPHQVAQKSTITTWPARSLSAGEYAPAISCAVNGGAGWSTRVIRGSSSRSGISPIVTPRVTGRPSRWTTNAAFTPVVSARICSIASVGSDTAWPSIAVTSSPIRTPAFAAGAPGMTWITRVDWRSKRTPIHGGAPGW